MNRDKQERYDQQSEAASQLLSALTLHSAETIAHLEELGEQLIQSNPELAGRMSQVINRLIARTQATPQAVTAMYLLTTEKPSEVIEGTIQEVIPEQSSYEEKGNDYMDCPGRDIGRDHSSRNVW